MLNKLAILNAEPLKILDLLDQSIPEDQVLIWFLCKRKNKPITSEIDKATINSLFEIS